ncbi:glycogen debranching N-terminal domain-containing protein [Micromonospora sp. NPDC050495]|uniref:amylo-alpha-1,6-glucosidase n=1 Tax=Micromonospora sp. NPDC050495 TaxID=3154936 RepID=UPI00340D2410
MTTTGRRPTPADPTPDITPEGQIPSGMVRNLPPELGPDAIAVQQAHTFMYSNAVGDVAPGSIGGLTHDDTRMVYQWELTLNGAPLLVLGSGAVEPYSAVFFLTNPELPGLQANQVGVRRQRFVDGGLHERIQVQSFNPEPLSLEVRLAVGTDFADIFEIKEIVRDRSAQISRSHAPDGSWLQFSYRNGSFEAVTRVNADPPASRVEGDTLVWDVRLELKQEWRCELYVPLRVGPEEMRPPRRDFEEVFGGGAADRAAQWRSLAPRVRSDLDLLRAVWDKTVVDSTALMIEVESRGRTSIFYAAGMPWFLALFGRDSLIASYQSLSFAPRSSRQALLSLAAMQGTKVDDFSDEEPGKILHEIRNGELTRLGIKPHNPYYGSADTTQLWLILLSEYWRWTCDDEFVRELRDNAYAALRWIDEYGDRDGDGYVDYATRSPQGLGNQCWRDSWDGVRFADGTIPVLPIATCEIQGYTYDAKLRMAELADGPLRDPRLARQLRAEAAGLRDRFNRDFWIEDRGGFYALGIDGDNRLIDSMTSNMGHLLWSGIVPVDRAAIVAQQLMSDEMFSGWGVRTTSAAERGYNPIGYHMGTVWPHDNSLIALGLACYGFRQEANRIIMAMLDAAKYSNGRLPEAFSGYDRSYGQAPVPYPTACSPQAWATCAPLLFVRTMLGFDARDGQLVAEPDIPLRIGRIELTGTHAFGKLWDLEAIGTQAYIRRSLREFRHAPDLREGGLRPSHS